MINQGERILCKPKQKQIPEMYHFFERSPAYSLLLPILKFTKIGFNLAANAIV